MEEGRVEVPGGRLAVHVDGSGPPIVLLHAGIVDARAWAPMTPHLIAAGYRVVAFDRRGIGGSVTEDVEYSNRADVVAVLDALGIGRACLVGNSIGSIIALDTALEFPARVSAVVSVAPGIGGYWPPEPTGLEAELFAEAERLEEAGDDPDAIADLDVRLWLDGPGQPTDRLPAELRDAARAMDRAIADPARVRGRAIPLEPPAIERLESVSVPVLAVVGGLDAEESAAAAAVLVERVPSARAALMPDVAHLIGMEAPAELAALMGEFLAPQARWD